MFASNHTLTHSASHTPLVTPQTHMVYLSYDSSPVAGIQTPHTHIHMHAEQTVPQPEK